MHRRTSSGGLDWASRASIAPHIRVQRAIVYAGMTTDTRNESTHSESDRLAPSPTPTGFVPSLIPGASGSGPQTTQPQVQQVGSSRHTHLNRTRHARRAFDTRRALESSRRAKRGSAGNLSADFGFVGQALFRGVANELRQALRGDAWGVVRAAAIGAGIVLAGSGHMVGPRRWHRRAPERCRSWVGVRLHLGDVH